MAEEPTEKRKLSHHLYLTEEAHTLVKILAEELGVRRYQAAAIAFRLALAKPQEAREYLAAEIEKQKKAKKRK